MSAPIDELERDLEPERRTPKPQLETALAPLAKRLNPWLGMIIALVIGFIVVAVMLSFADEVYEWVRADAGTGTAVDAPVHAWGTEIRQPWLTPFVVVLTNLGGQIGMPIVAAVIVAALVYFGRSWRALVLVGIAAAGSVVLTIVSKQAVGRERPPRADMLPPYDTSPSFPSGHTLNAVAIMTVVAYVCVLQLHRLSTRIIAVAGCVVFAVGVALTRIYLGQHWFTDVLAAAALGLAWAAVVIIGHRVFVTIRAARRRAREGRLVAAEVGSEARSEAA